MSDPYVVTNVASSVKPITLLPITLNVVKKSVFITWRNSEGYDCDQSQEVSPHGNNMCSSLDKLTGKNSSIEGV